MSLDSARDLNPSEKLVEGLKSFLYTKRVTVRSILADKTIELNFTSPSMVSAVNYYD